MKMLVDLLKCLLHRCPNLGLLPHPELVDDQKLLKLKEQLDAFCSEDSLNQVQSWKSCVVQSRIFLMFWLCWFHSLLVCFNFDT
jgi:hypothetical protein